MVSEIMILKGTFDGGKKWKRVLGDSEWTGATDLLIDPSVKLKKHI